MIQDFYAIDLPGKILYEKEFNCSVRKITPIEQKFILSMSQKEQKTNRDYINFIKKLVTFDNPEMTFEQLYWFDVQYILYRIRLVTYPRYPVNLFFKCNELDENTGEYCKAEIKHQLKIEDLAISTPDDLPELTNEIELDNLGKVKIRNKIMQDDITIDEFVKKHRIDMDDHQMRLLLLDLCLISSEKSLEELYAAAERGEITAEDIIKIEDWFTKNIWGIKEEVTVTCPVCKKERSKAYVLSIEDFFSAIQY